MPKLGIELNNDINKTTNDFKKLNKTVDKTAEGVDKIDSRSKKLGKTMSTSFKAFLVGGAVQLGFKALLKDIDESNKKAAVLTESLKTLRFLGSEADVASAKRLQKSLAGEFGFSPSRVGAIAAEVKSTAGDFDVATREQIVAQAAAAEKGGIGDAKKFAATSTQIALLNKDFQSAQGITSVGNILSQGIIEAKLEEKDIDILGAAILAGKGAGLSEAQSVGQFATLTTLTTTKDEAKEKFKQIALQYVKSGAKSKGISFNDWVDTVARTPFDKLPEPLQTLHSIIISLSEQRKTTEGKTSRVLSAQKNQSSLAKAAFEKQVADPQQFQNITNERQAALKELVSADPTRRGGSEALSDLVSAGGEGLGATLKTGLSFSPLALAGTAISELSGGIVPDVGGILRGSAGENIERASIDVDAIKSALENNNSTSQSQNANLQVNRQIQGGF